MFSKFKSIKVKYTFVGLAICLISLLIASTFSYIISYNITSDLSNKMIHEAVLRNSAEINHWFTNRENIVESLSQDIEASGDFTPSSLSKLIRNKMEIYKDDVLDFYIGFEGNEPQLISGVDWTPPSGYDATARDWYKLAKDSDEVIFTEPYLDAMTGDLVITVAKALKSNQQIIGVLATDIYLTDVREAVYGAKINENSYGLLLNNKGEIIVHPNPDFLPDENGFKSAGQIDWQDYGNLVQILLTKGADHGVELNDYTGNEAFFNFSKITSNNWYFGIAVNKSEYIKPLRTILLGFAGVFLASVFIGLIILLRLIDKMIKPIKSLNDTVKDFSANNMSARTKVISEDEIGELGRSFNRMADIIEEYNQSLEKKVEERTNELKMKNEMIMESIEYARRIQSAIIPDISEKLSIAGENCFSIWEPRDTVGGDMFWGKSNENYALLAVADCTGHGVPGAFMSMMLSSILDAIYRERAGDNPAEMLNIIDSRLKEALGQDENGYKINDGADMALLCIDKQNKRLVFSGAKLNLFIVSKGDVQVVKGSKRSIGYSKRTVKYFENVELPYNSGDIYYFTTDGLLDQNCEEDKGGMGRRGFMLLIEDIYHLSMEEQKKSIENNIKERLSQAPQRDDITVIGLKL